MENKKLKRTIFFEEIEEEKDLIWNYQAAYCNWNLKDMIKHNANNLKKVLGVNDIQNVKIKILNAASESDENLRVYVYKTQKCNTEALNIHDVSHALQVSLGNKERSNWVSADSDFSAKVFIDDEKKLMMLIEDVVLDIQMFYFFNCEKNYNDYMKRREFSKKKVKFLLNQGAGSYLGDVKDTEYISFASFCREGNDNNINYTKYKSIWEDFIDIINNEDMNKKENLSVKQILSSHPKYRQLSISKIERCLATLPCGEYILIRTEKKPKTGKKCREIKSWFGMKKWKTGKIKVVSSKYYYTYQKLIPYISIFEFYWGGDKA